MKKKKENYVTIPVLKSVVNDIVKKSETKILSMLATTEDRIMDNMAEAVGLSERKMTNAIAKVDARTTETQVLLIDTRNTVNQVVDGVNMLEKRIIGVEEKVVGVENKMGGMENRIIRIISEKIDRLDERFVTRREFLGA